VRSGKRTGTAALNMAMDMLDERLIDAATVVTRVEPGTSTAPASLRRSRGREDGAADRRGLPARGRRGRQIASPGGRCRGPGEAGQHVILVAREMTKPKPEDSR